MTSHSNQQKPIYIDIDLEWAAWSTNTSLWDDYEPKARQIIESAWSGEGPPVEVSSAPCKELRYGKITVSHRCVSGDFWSSWDEVEELADTLGLYDEDGNWNTGDWDPPEDWSQGKINAECLQGFAESIPHNDYGEPGNHVSFSLKDSDMSFDEMLSYVDGFEEKLMEEDEKDWAALKEMYRRG